MPTLQLTDSQKCALSIQPVDAKGQAAPADGVPAWTTSNADVAAVTPSADGLTAEVVAGVPGTATVSVSDSVGGVDIAGTLDVVVVPGAAVSVSIVAGTPEAQ